MLTIVRVNFSGWLSPITNGDLLRKCADAPGSSEIRKKITIGISILRFA